MLKLKLTSFALVAALVVIVIPTSASAADPPLVAYTTSDAYEQELTPDGVPVGAPEKVDPDQHKPTKAEKAGKPNQRVVKYGSRELQATSCKTVGQRVKAFSSLNIWLWSYWQYARYCSNGTSVTALPERWVQVEFGSLQDFVWSYDGPWSSAGYWYTYGGYSHGGHYGMRQGHMLLKTWPGLITLSHRYPQVKIWVRGNGTWASETAG